MTSCAFQPKRPDLFVCVVDFKTGSALCRDAKEETPVLKNVKITQLESPQICLPPKSWQSVQDYLDSARHSIGD